MRPATAATGAENSAAAASIAGDAEPSACKKPLIYWDFPRGTGFADQPRGRWAASGGDCRSLTMLFALGAAASALEAVSSLTSGASSSNASSPQSTGFSAVDPFQIASPVSASASSAPASGFGAGSPISPATLNTLLAAQGQSSTGSDSSASAGASNAGQDLSSQIDSDVGSSDSSAAAASHKSLAQLLQRQMNAMSFSAPPMSFSV